jgi:hypothetical protein
VFASRTQTKLRLSGPSLDRADHAIDAILISDNVTPLDQILPYFLSRLAAVFGYAARTIILRVFCQTHTFSMSRRCIQRKSVPSNCAQAGYSA